MGLCSDVDSNEVHPDSSWNRSGASLAVFALTLVDARTRPLDTVRATKKKTGRGRLSYLRRRSFTPGDTATLSRNLSSKCTLPRRDQRGQHFANKIGRGRQPHLRGRSLTQGGPATLSRNIGGLGRQPDLRGRSLIPGDPAILARAVCRWPLHRRTSRGPDTSPGSWPSPYWPRQKPLYRRHR